MTPARSLTLILTLALLSACAEGQNPFARKTDGAASPASADAGAPQGEVPQATSVKLVDRDVEAPDVFQVTDTGLWDGRPSLGGVWVASPDAVDPERVILRNPSNGKFVIGALFKRERENPGPSLQISSDAAEALGLLAGQPAKISVTALRREEAPVATTAAKPLLDAAETITTETLAQGGDAQAKTTANGAATAAATATATATGAAKAASTGVVNTPPRAAADAKGQANAETAASAIAAASTAKITEGKAKAASDSSAAQPTKEPAAQAAAAPKAQAPQAQAPAPQAQAPKAQASASAAGSYIQIGLFSIEANAKRAVAQLNAAGIASQMRQETSKGKVFYSVGARGDAGVLAKIKAAGFKDAYPTKG